MINMSCRGIYEKATEKFSDLLDYDPTIYQALYRKARQYTSMFKKVEDFKSQTVSWENNNSNQNIQAAKLFYLIRIILTPQRHYSTR